MPATLAELQRKAEDVFDHLNNRERRMIVRAVLNMRKRAQMCIQANGGLFEGRKLA